jgi:hypothetical protein
MSYGSFSPPRRVEILIGSGTGYFKTGQYAYALSWDTRGGQFLVNVNRSGPVRRGEKVFLISKTKGGRGGALWMSKDAVRFTDQGRRKGGLLGVAQ